MKLLKSAWQVLDGNKSIICLSIFSILGLDGAKEVFDPEWVEFLREVFKWLSAGSIGDHMRKGFLKKNKGS